MTPEERQMLADLFQRVSTTGTAPRDAQAEAFINDAVRALPYAPYVLAQTVLVQQHALEAATQRISELEAQARQAPAQPAQETSFLGSLGRNLFGGGAAPAPQLRSSNPYDASAYQRSAGPAPSPAYAPQQPSAYAPQPQPGPWGAPAAPAGGGFLSGALHTAAGVAGGMMLANAVEGLLGGRGGLFGGNNVGFGNNMGMGGFEAPREVINNYYEGAPGVGQSSQDIDRFADSPQDDSQDVADDANWDDGSAGDDSYDA